MKCFKIEKKEIYNKTCIDKNFGAKCFCQTRGVNICVRALSNKRRVSNTPVSSYDEVTSLCMCSSFSEARKVFVYVNGGTDAAWDA